LRLGLRGRWRQRFGALLERIAALAVATVAQFTDDQENPSPKALETAAVPLPTKPTSGARLSLLG